MARKPTPEAFRVDQSPTTGTDDMDETAATPATRYDPMLDSGDNWGLLGADRLAEIRNQLVYIPERSAYYFRRRIAEGQDGLWCLDDYVSEHKRPTLTLIISSGVAFDRRNPGESFRLNLHGFTPFI